MKIKTQNKLHSKTKLKQKLVNHHQAFSKMNQPLLVSRLDLNLRKLLLNSRDKTNLKRESKNVRKQLQPSLGIRMFYPWWKLTQKMLKSQLNLLCICPVFLIIWLKKSLCMLVTMLHIPRRIQSLILIILLQPSRWTQKWENA